VSEATNLPPLNEKLIACVLEHIEAFPEEYNQNDWILRRGCKSDEWCGTQGCFAGWTILLSVPVARWDSYAQQPCWRGSYRQTAAELLGLTGSEALNLFAGSDSDNPHKNLATIKGRLRQIRINRGLPPEATQKGDVR
jgi:hypothetical protein